MTNESSVNFMRRLKLTSPIKIAKILTDNGSQFTDRFATKDKKPSGEHAFDRARTSMAIEHRLAPPRHPQPTGWWSDSTAVLTNYCSKPVSTVKPTWRRPCSTTSSYTTTIFLSAPSAPRRLSKRSRSGNEPSLSYSLNASMTTRDLTINRGNLLLLIIVIATSILPSAHASDSMAR
jgi:hypothetical protein